MNDDLGMSFSEALNKIKQGEKLARAGWNGKDMFVFLVEGSRFEVNRKPLNEMFPTGTEVIYRPHIDMKAADGTIGVWAATMSDILTNDWVIVA